MSLRRRTNRLFKVEQQRNELTESQRVNEVELLNKAKTYVEMALRLLREVSPGNVYDKDYLEEVRTELCMAYLDRIPSLIRERTPEITDKPSHTHALCDCYAGDIENDEELQFDLAKFKAMPQERQMIAREAIRLSNPEDLSADEKRVLAGEF